MPRPESGLAPDARLRAEIVAVLRGGHAHVDTRTALADLPAARVNDRPDGFPHSLWDLVEHLRIAQRDILDFALDADYEALAWPDDYWPDADATPAAWEAARRAFLADLDAVVALVEDEATDPLTELDHAPGYTILRQALLVADHNAHHLGQVVAVRRALGLW
ncbi:MAG: DinB family protein [Rhodothermales bacterium]